MRGEKNDGIEPLLGLEVLAVGDLASVWRQTKCQLGKTFFHRPAFGLCLALKLFLGCI